MNSQQVGPSSGLSTGNPESAQTSYLLRKIQRLEQDLEAEKRRARTLYNEGFRAGRNEWAELTARWRRAFETLEEYAKARNDGDEKRLVGILRSWVGRA